MKRKTKLTIAAASALALTGIAGTAWATIPSRGGVIHGCHSNATGNLRVIDAATDSCRTDESELNWNQQGEPGPTGIQGPAGIPGAKGDPGDPASVPSGTIYGLQTIAFNGSIPMDDGNQQQYKGFDCPSGMVAIAAAGNMQVGSDYATPLPLILLAPSATSDETSGGLPYTTHATEVVFNWLNKTGKDEDYVVTLTCAHVTN